MKFSGSYYSPVPHAIVDLWISCDPPPIRTAPVNSSEVNSACRLPSPVCDTPILLPPLGSTGFRRSKKEETKQGRIVHFSYLLLPFGVFN